MLRNMVYFQESDILMIQFFLWGQKKTEKCVFRFGDEQSLESECMNRGHCWLPGWVSGALWWEMCQSVGLGWWLGRSWTSWPDPPSFTRLWAVMRPCYWQGLALTGSCHDSLTAACRTWWPLLPCFVAVVLKLPAWVSLGLSCVSHKSGTIWSPLPATAKLSLAHFEGCLPWIWSKGLTRLLSVWMIHQCREVEWRTHASVKDI